MSTASGNGEGALSGIRSDIARSTPQTIRIRGFDLMGDLLGKVNLGDFAFLELFHRLPTDDESVVFNAMVVSLVEHGTTPNSIAARLTYLGAPEALQAAVAAGLLGLGTTFVGTIEGSARLLQELEGDDWKGDAEARRRAAEQIVDEHRTAKRAVPGIGHPVHRPLDPRAERLFELAREHDFDPAYEAIMREIAAVAEERLSRELPVNVTGAIGALATAMGLRWEVCRGLGVMARAVGLVGHILEELDDPMALKVWRATQEAAEGGGH